MVKKVQLCAIALIGRKGIFKAFYNIWDPACALIGQKPMFYLTNKEAYAVYYTVIKHDGHLRKRGKCRKHEPQASVFYISRVFPNSDKTNR